MLKASILFIFSYLCILACNAQTIPELEQKIESTKDVKTKIDLTNDLSIIQFRANDKRALSTAEKNLTLARSISYKEGIITAILQTIFISEKISTNALQEAGLQEALNLATSLKNDKLIGDCLLAFSQYYFSRAGYDKSIEYGLNSLQKFEKINDVKGIIRAKSKLAQTYQMRDELPKAEATLLEILQYKESQKSGYSVTLHTLANVYGMQGKYKEALAIDEIGLRYCDSVGLLNLKSSFYDNMANCFMYSGDFEKAKKFFNISLALDSSNNDSRLMSDTYLNLGQLYIMNDKSDAAIPYLLRSINLSKQVSYKEATATAYKLLSEVYQKNNKLDSAIINLKRHYLYKDSIINLSSENKIAEFQTIYETEKKESQIQSQKLKLNKQRSGIVALVASLGIISLIALMLYRRKQHQAKIELQKEILQQQKLATAAIISAEEKERIRIATELHDGVGQMVSAAKMNLSVLDNDMSFADDEQKEKLSNVIDMLDESCVEIRAVSHQMMPVAMFNNGVSEALQIFIQRIDQKVIDVDFYSDGESKLSKEKESVLYRILQECINNVIKHAKANKLSISIHHSNKETSVTVEDDGIGFDKNDNSGSGIGLSNILSRVNYLNGEIDFESRIGFGTLVSIHIPV